MEMDMKTVLIDGVEYVRKSDAKSAIPVVTDDFVIVRCHNAGVHAGTLVEHTPMVVKLKNSRRLWRWWSKFTLSGLAMEGPLASKMDKQKYACVLPELVLNTSDVCEIIPCSEKAALAIMAVPETENV